MPTTAIRTLTATLDIRVFDTDLIVQGVQGRTNVVVRPGESLFGAAARLLLHVSGYVPTGKWTGGTPGRAVATWEVPVAPHPLRCDTCITGCECDPRDTAAGCEHWNCWGKGQGDLFRSCPYAQVLKTVA